ncbi:MAG: P-loop containing nucleoside triphosphate hydrolase protein [Benjaminiella poitrasii]|nr:MAG: P-loop containing nucleoside triphosphate hydrolase protein [Benjaminiella poitrasii]
MAPLEVIGAGFGRTGTDSLRIALNMLGYNTHHMKCFFEDPSFDPDVFYDAFLHRDTADWDEVYKDYNAAVDWPTAEFYKELFQKYPKAKVLLTTRSADSWYKSAFNTVHKAAIQPNTHHEGFRRLAVDVPMNGRFGNKELFADEEGTKKIFLDHIEEVKRFIPKDQLLVMELGEGWDRLCKFLGKDIPKEPYPTANSTSDFKRLFNNVNGAELLTTDDK